jgi:hypothetical protein
MGNKLYSDYQMFSYGPSKSLRCLRYVLRNPDADARTVADACKASYNVAWAAKADIKIHGREAMLPLAKFDVPDPIPPVVKSKNYKPKAESLRVEEVPVEREDAVLDVLTNPNLDIDLLANKLRELGFERVTASTEETNKSVLEPQVTKTPPLEMKLEKGAQVSDGSTASYYELPDGACELQDLISHKNMNAQIGEIFRSCYRMGEASHSDALRDAKKIRFYIDAEIERLLRK